MYQRAAGDPEYVREVVAQLDEEPLEFPWSASVRATWITDAVVRDLEES